jgi:hypothetical protein
MRDPMLSKVVLFVLFALCVGTALPGWTQAVATGTVQGAVTDPTGAVVPGATVTLTNNATGASVTSGTNDAGRYVLVNVSPGDYVISVAKQGFATTKTQGTVNVGSVLTVNLRMEVGGATTTVEVSAAGVQLQTTNATVGNTINSTAIDSLPSLNRDVTTFVELQPGVSPDGSVAGTVVDQSTFMLDGGQNTNDMDGSMSVYTNTYAGDPTGGVSNGSLAVAAGPTGVMPTPADSVEEFKVNTAGQSADFNSSSGAQVQVVTRRGTNTWHGSVYEYYLDNNFSANTWDNNFSGTPVPDWHRNRFGARAGGPILPEMLGGKTYIFANYEGYRWPNSVTYERAVPSDAMRLGLLTFGGVTYNLNPTPVTFNGTTYAGSTLDPRALGINPTVQQLWNKMPQSNESACGINRCDNVNVQGFRANVPIPTDSNFGVVRLDHDFGPKWHFMSSYRYFKLTAAGTEQVDISNGKATSLSSNPQQPWYLVAGVTTNISPNVTNDVHYSFLRNWWAWSRFGGVPQLSGLGGALEPFGESATAALTPYNVNTQQTRTRFWDGKDHYIRDDVSWLKGNHLLQFGGAYQHNFNWHQRTDNGGGINYQAVYQMGITSGAGIDMASVFGQIPGLDSSNDKNFGRDYVAALGIVSISQIAYTRTGKNLQLNPPLTPAFDQSTIPYYNVYFSDTWHLRPSLTLTYGLGWTLEMPPVETDGKQIELVDINNKVLDSQAYLNSREQAALQGQVYNPFVGFNLVGNTGRKYPYDPYYHSFSPRVAVAWNPLGNNNTVIRAGYGRIFGRLNGVDLVLVPLLGTGLIQPVQCFGPDKGGVACNGASNATPANTFRIGTDGLTVQLPPATPTLPQPLYPGINGIAAGAGEALDPHFRPNYVDSIDYTLQHQFTRNFTAEVGYIGRFIHHEYQPININSVPYMMTLGGQRFDKAYANVVWQYCGGNAGMAGSACAANAAAVQPQPFFEAALAGTGYCTGFANCTQALVANEGINGTGNLTFSNVWSLWSDLDNGNFNFPRSMMNTAIPGQAFGGSGQLTSGVGVNASVGHGNYNGFFASVKMNDFHGLTAQSNFTWSKALSSLAVVQATSEATATDPYNLNLGYGPAGFDRKFVYNLFFVYQPPYYKGQSGLVGHILGGWTVAPIFAVGTGVPMILGTVNGGGQGFGEGDSTNFFAQGESENAIPITNLPTSSVHKVSGNFPNLYGNPSAVYNQVRQPILGLDEKDGGWGFPRGLGYWNIDLSIKKNFKITERFNVEAQAVFTNLFNHVVFFDPGFGGAEGNDYLDTSSPSSWGTVAGQGNTPRTMEFGLRFNF